MLVVSSISPAAPSASYVSSVSTTHCQSSLAIPLPQKKKTRRAGRRIRAARLQSHSSPSSDPTTVSPTVSTPSASCPLEDSIIDIMAILAGVLDLLKKTLVETPKKIADLRGVTRLEIALIWDQFRNLMASGTVFTSAHLTGDSQHLKPP